MLCTIQFSSVQSLSRVRLFATPWITAHQASLSNTNVRSSLRFTSIESVMPSNHLILCRPLLLLPSIFPSIRVFSNESVLHIRSPKYWSFSFSNSPSNEYSGLISFRTDRFGLLVVQGTLKSLLQHHSSKASILQCSAVLYYIYSLYTVWMWKCWSLSHVQLFVTPWTVADQALLSSTVSWSFLKFTFSKLVMLSNHPILCCPLFLLP